MRKRDFKIVRDNGGFIIGILVKKSDFHRVKTVENFNPYTLEYYGEAANKCDKCGLHKYCKPYNYVYSQCEKVSYNCSERGTEIFFGEAEYLDPVRSLWTIAEWDAYFETPEGKEEEKALKEEWLSVRNELKELEEE